jgi:hypothetical protein
MNATITQIIVKWTPMVSYLSTRYKPSGVWGVYRADDGDKRDKAEKLKRGKRVNRGPIRWEIKEIPTNTNQSDDPDRS